ncbi:YciI family protein [Bowmanella dokdonensis]|uniref:GTP cyclohydrolase n=1 Tax=Bowmanella dokdonensis TaxID=751969 RepID=A0A939DJU6_9ALTE|nr:YciI family protein [Bowmanella dokdonensis]MBN7823854.1 GTP cyclohydrolase [Bowmanella dokdonensis]
MFVVVLTYRRPIEEVERHLAEHIDFLDAQYQAGVFVASGRRVPRTGGVILAISVDQVSLTQILDLDPFKREGIADYEIVEFVPNRTKPGLEALME